MKRNIYLLSIAFVLLFSNLYSKDYNGKLSPFAKSLLSKKYDKQENLESESFVNSIILYNSEFNFEDAKQLGVKFSTITSKTATALIPISSLQNVSSLKGILYIDADKTSGFKMDSARAITGIDKVLSGINSEIPTFSGKGVVIGVIDAGFDFTHPAFYNSETGKIIISRVWDQGKSGNSPEQFNYGAEYATEEEILNAQKDINDFSHGTHVASITCGQEVQGVEKFHGAALDAELVIVAVKPPAQEQWYNAGAADFVDAVKYIFDYAASVDKPAIVNLSWGGQMGPHDGSSPFSQAIDELTGPGRLFACSAGNDAQTALHLYKKFSDADTSVCTYFSNVYDKTSSKNGIWIDSWANQGDTISYILEMINPKTRDILFSSDTVYSLIDFSKSYQYETETDTCSINVLSNNMEYNGKPHFFINIEANKDFRFRVKAFSHSAEINMWNWYLVDYTGIEKPFVAFSDENAVYGDKDYTISDFSSTVNAVSVGAFVSKSKYLDEKNIERNYGVTVGSIAAFSSKGPLNPVVVKPDIVAPGMCLAAGVSSFDTEFSPEASSTSVVNRVSHNDKNYPYAVLSGTSMSCPLTSGAIALLLSIKNDLAPSDIIQLLSETADTDSFTGDVPNNTWGNGKLNLYNAAKQLFTKTNVNESIENKILLYPNPSPTTIRINLDLNDYFVEIYNSNFQLILNNYVSNSNEEINIASLASGQYFIIIRKNDKPVFRGVLNKVK